MVFQIFKQQRGKDEQRLINRVSKLLDDSLIFKKDSLISQNSDAILTYLGRLRKKIKKQHLNLKENYDYLQKRFNLISEMRLYGSNLETISDSLKEIKGSLSFEIDWRKASYDKLPLIIDKDIALVESLDKKSQQHLKEIWQHLFFEKSLFVANWHGFLKNKKGQIGFLIFDSLNKAAFELKKFALDYINKKKEPKTFEEKLLVDSIDNLQKSCPDINAFEGWDKTHISKESSSDNDSYFDYISENNPDIFSKFTQGTNPGKLFHLLDSSRHTKDPRFSKRSFFYVAPLIIIVYILYKFSK